MSVYKVRVPQQEKSWYLPAIFVGLGFTFKKMIQNLANKKQMPTLNYPEEKHQYSPRFKGNHVFDNHAGG